jgi:hypothetical protein
MPASDTQLQLLIDKALGGDEVARNALLDHACDQLRAYAYFQGGK